MQERANQPKQKIEYNFDVTKHIRLVPPFQEKEVDKYFLHFEKVAENLNWPKEHWTLLLQSVLILIISFYLSSLPVAHLSDAPRRRLVVTGDSARIQDETTENSAWFFNVLGV